MVLHSVVLGVVLGMGVIIWVVTWLLLTIVHVQYYCRFDDVDQSGRYLFLTSELVLWWVLTTDCPFFTSEADYLGILKESIDTTHLLYISSSGRRRMNDTIPTFVYRWNVCDIFVYFKWLAGFLFRIECPLS